MASPNNKRSESHSGEDNGIDIKDTASVASSSDVGSAVSDSSDHDQTVTNTESTASPFKEESRVIARYKMLTLIAIAVTAVGCGIATYFIVAGRQKAEFHLKVSHVFTHTTARNVAFHSVCLTLNLFLFYA